MTKEVNKIIFYSLSLSKTSTVRETGSSIILLSSSDVSDILTKNILFSSISTSSSIITGTHCCVSPTANVREPFGHRKTTKTEAYKQK